MKKNFIFYTLIIVLGIALDQLVKRLAVLFLEPVGSIPIINGVFNLTYTENTGAAFSIFSDKTVFLSIITAIVLSFIVFLLVTNKIIGKLSKYSLVLIVAGGMGNLIDRIFYGFVVDMFDFCLINFAIFNVADIFVSCGTVALLIAFIINKGDILQWKKSQ